MKMATKEPAICMSRCLFVFCTMVLFSTLVLVRISSSSPVTSGGVSGPLYLTPYIESNRTEDGRKLARVTGLGWQQESYSGLLTVNKTYGSNMFFWYFPSERNADEVPLLVWLNGFSTASSYGIFLQNGPYDLLESTDLKPRNISWQKYYHVVYIDNPIGVGFSTTDSEEGYSTDLDNIGDNLYTALDQFLNLFPELKTRELYLTGLSLAGKYLVGFASKINERKEFNLKGVFVGDPLLDPSKQIHYGQFLLELGFIDTNQKSVIDAIEQELRDEYNAMDYKSVYEKAGQLVLNDNSLIINMTGLNSIYDYNEPYINPNYFFEYISRLDVRQALHVGDNQFDQGAKAMSKAAKFFVEPVSNILEKLLEEVRVLIYVGQMDVVCAYPMLVNVFESLNWSGREGYINATRIKLYNPAHDYVWGFLKTYQTFTDVMVRKAGHSAITNHPDHIVDLLFNFTHYDRF